MALPGEASVGRAVALFSLAPVARRIADERERAAQRAAEGMRIEGELASLPSLPRPEMPGLPSPWWTRGREFREVVLGIVIVGIPAGVLIAAFIMLGTQLLFGEGSIGGYFGIVLGILAGGAAAFGRTISDSRDELRAEREAIAARAEYPRRAQEFDDREAARRALERRLEEARR
jgi:hypothetical protein